MPITIDSGQPLQRSQLGTLPSRGALVQVQEVAAAFKDEEVPNFSGLTVREVTQLLNQEMPQQGDHPGDHPGDRLRDHLRDQMKRESQAQNEKWGEIQLIGTGTAKSQWPLPGQHRNKNQKLKVIFKPQS